MISTAGRRGDVGRHQFGARHFRDIERLAMVGETKWQHGMAIFGKPFTTAMVRYFEHDEVEAARAWVSEP